MKLYDLIKHYIENTTEDKFINENKEVYTCEAGVVYKDDKAIFKLSDYNIGIKPYKAKEMTIEDIEKALGHEVIIIDNDPKPTSKVKSSNSSIVTGPWQEDELSRIEGLLDEGLAVSDITDILYKELKRTKSSIMNKVYAVRKEHTISIKRSFNTDRLYNIIVDKKGLLRSYDAMYVKSEDDKHIFISEGINITVWDNEISDGTITIKELSRI